MKNAHKGVKLLIVGVFLFFCSAVMLSSENRRNGINLQPVSLQPDGNQKEEDYDKQRLASNKQLLVSKLADLDAEYQHVFEQLERVRERRQHYVEKAGSHPDRSDFVSWIECCDQEILDTEEYLNNSYYAARQRLHDVYGRN